MSLCMRLELGRRMMLVLMRSLPSRVMGIGCRQDGFCWEVCAWKFVVVPKDYIGTRTRMTCGSSRHICRPTCGGRAGLAVQGRGAVWCQSREHSRPRFNIRGEGTILGSVVAIGIRKRRDIDFRFLCAVKQPRLGLPPRLLVMFVHSAIRQVSLPLSFLGDVSALCIEGLASLAARELACTSDLRHYRY